VVGEVSVSSNLSISDLEGKVINPSVNVKKNCTRLTARTTTLIERRGTFLHGASPVVSCALFL